MSQYVKDFVWGLRPLQHDEKLYFVWGQNRGDLHWMYVRVREDKDEMFRAQCKNGDVNVTDFGEIMCVGWGRLPPREIEDQIRKGYGVPIDPPLSSQLELIQLVRGEDSGNPAWYYVEIEEHK